MGFFGPGNFDNDAAIDFVEGVVTKVREELVPPTEFEDIALMMAAIGIYKILAENCYATLPDRTELEALRKKTLDIYDRESDLFTTDSNADQIAERRRIIASTFDEFLRMRDDD